MQSKFSYCLLKIEEIHDLKNDYAGSIRTSDWNSTWNIYVKFSTMPTDMFPNTKLNLQMR